jgi:hypothetical protein
MSASIIGRFFLFDDVIPGCSFMRLLDGGGKEGAERAPMMGSSTAPFSSNISTWNNPPLYNESFGLKLGL